MTGTPLRRHSFSLVSGIVVCIIGITILIFILPADFLHPGFVDDGILIQSQQLSPRQSINSAIQVDDTNKGVAVFIVNPSYNIPLKIDIKNPDGMTIYTSYLDTKEVTFNPDIIGKYTVMITNKGSETAVLSASYGHYIDQTLSTNEFRTILEILSVIFVIVGSYFIINIDFGLLSTPRNNFQ